MSSSASTSTCPCGSKHPYADCCRRLHAGDPAPDAEALMRSRYSAFVLGLENYLLASWHPDTRPAPPIFDANSRTKWLRLEVLDHSPIDAEHAEVEFIARYIEAGQHRRLHERSSFLREDGRWYYVDGDIIPD